MTRQRARILLEDEIARWQQFHCAPWCEAEVSWEWWRILVTVYRARLSSCGPQGT